MTDWGRSPPPLHHNEPQFNSPTARSTDITDNDESWWQDWSVVSSLLIKAGDEALAQQKRGVNWRLPNHLKDRMEIFKSIRILIMAMRKPPGTCREDFSGDLQRVREGHDHLTNLREMFTDMHDPVLGGIMHNLIGTAEKDPSIVVREVLTLDQRWEKTRYEMRELERILAATNDTDYLTGLWTGFDTKIKKIWQVANGPDLTFLDEGDDLHLHISWTVQADEINGVPSELLSGRYQQKRRRRLRSLYWMQRDNGFERLYAPLVRLREVVKRLIDSDLLRRGYNEPIGEQQYEEWAERVTREIENYGDRDQ